MLRSARKTLARKLFSLAGRVGACDPREAIVIAGSPRSGTTLLLETLLLLPGAKGLNEPLIRKHVRELHGFETRSFMEPGEVHESREAFLERVLRGRMGPEARWVFPGGTGQPELLRHALRRQLIVKFCRLNRMYSWFIERFQVRRAILIVRHPCAVVASMKRYGPWSGWDWKDPRIRQAFSLDDGTLPEPLRNRFRPILDRVDSQVSALAAMWCMDHFVPLVHASRPVPWILVPYERLILHRTAEIERITDFLGLKSFTEMADRLTSPSSSVLDAPEMDLQDQLSRWKKHLSPEEIQVVLSMVDDVGLSRFYDASTEPGYDALDALQEPGSRWGPLPAPPCDYPSRRRDSSPPEVRPPSHLAGPEDPG